MQEHTSAQTSRNQVPALHKALVRTGAFRGVNADLGGGRFDKATEYLHEQGVENIVHDKFNRSDEHNAWAWSAIKRRAKTVTVANVLNVIAEPKCREAVIQQAATLGVPTYFTVYEGDGSGKGRRTRDGWQENRKLATYLPEIEQHFASVEIQRLGGLAVIVATSGV